MDMMMMMMSENPKVVFSLFETVKLPVSISPRNLYNSSKSIKETVFIFITQIHII